MKGRDKQLTAVLAVTRRGLGIAKKIAAALGNAEIIRPALIKSRGLGRVTASAFSRADALVFISAAGIAVRAIAPFIKAKHIDPAVLVVDETGRFSISLLSGHIGGANALAKKIAAATGAQPVITTATDLNGLPCAEDIAKRFSLIIENTGRIKAVNSALLQGGKVKIIDDNTARLRQMKKAFGNSFSYGQAISIKDKGNTIVLITSSSKGLGRKALVMRPRDIVVGVGCGKGVPKKEIREALLATLGKSCLSPASIRNFATIDLKKDERGLKALAKELGAEIASYDAARLGKVKCPSPDSRFVKNEVGTGSVAEAAALISSGAKKLCIRKTKCGRVTIAAARARYI